MARSVRTLSIGNFGFPGASPDRYFIAYPEGLGARRLACLHDRAAYYNSGILSPCESAVITLLSLVFIEQKENIVKRELGCHRPAR